MPRRSFGRTQKAAVIGQGTWKMEHDDRKTAIAAIHKGLELGMTHIDTAEMYGSGAVEELVGEAILGRRDQVFLVSKVLPQHASYEGTLRACDKSLKRLATDRLDSYLLHWPGSHPLAETIRAFEELVGKGKIVSWGLSNFDVRDLEEALAIAGPNKIACNQVLYHLEERGIEHAVLPWCERHGVATVAYSPLGAGAFPSDRSAGGQLLGEIARAHDATRHQVALAFLLRTQSVLAIPKAARAAHAADNAAAADLPLTADELRRIDHAFPRGRPPRSLPTL
jgi:diketogulonate reductase-like aldo/keto reductase